MDSISLEKYIDEKIKAIYAYIDLKTLAIDKSTSLAKESMERRLEGMNEFRDALKDQTARFITKEDFEKQHQRAIDDIKILRESKANLEGKASVSSVYIAYALSFITLLISILQFFIK